MKQLLVISLGSKVFREKGRKTEEVKKEKFSQIAKLFKKLSKTYDIVVFFDDNLKKTSETLQNHLKTENLSVSNIICRTIIDKSDKILKHPEKPIGKFYSEEEALKNIKQKGWHMKRYKNGYRRLIPTPKPVDILESSEIKSALQQNSVIIVSGGFPVQKCFGKKFKDIDALLEKDFIAEKLAESLKADTLILATNVEQVSLNFKTPNETPLARMSVSEAKKYLESGTFDSLTISPKIEACKDFAKTNKIAIICSLGNLEKSLKGKSGTTFI